MIKPYFFSILKNLAIVNKTQLFLRAILFAIRSHKPEWCQNRAKFWRKRRMKRFNYQDIVSWSPCYEPNRYLPENWEGTAVDILKDERIPFRDRLWVVLRTDLISERVMRLFAVWSYRQTLKFIKNPDPRSVEAANVAERFANSEATEAELSAAWYAARSAARYAARSAARSAAESAAESTAWYAAESAARSAQRDKLIEMIECEDRK